MHTALLLFTLVWLNCENLLDCQHWMKTCNIAKAIISSADGLGTLPDVAGVCEVRGDSVMQQLTKHTPMGRLHYEYVMTQSHDARGLSVALIYNEYSLRPLKYYSIHIEPKHKSWGPTRDILYVEGLVASGDTIHFFVVHAPSRVGGMQTNAYRKTVSERLCQSIDSIERTRPGAWIVAMGDFNAETGEKSLKILERQGLSDVTRKAKGRNTALGTYKYQGRWQSLDHVWTNAALLPFVKSARIHDPYVLLKRDANGRGWHPRRAMLGNFYDRYGCSDHLPLVVEMDWNKETAE